MSILLLLFVWNCCVTAAWSSLAHSDAEYKKGRNCGVVSSTVLYSYTHGTGDVLYTSSRAPAQTAEAERADEEW